MKTKITAYKGYVIINTPDDSDTIRKGSIVNEFFDDAPIFRLDLEDVEISQEAIDLLKSLSVEPDDEIADFSVYKNSDGKVVINWFGGESRVINAESLIGSSADLSLLVATPDLNPTEEDRDGIDYNMPDHFKLPIELKEA